MGLHITFTKVHEALEKSGIDHALIGGMALATLGIHRATQDVDLLIDGEQRTSAVQCLERAGFKLIFETKEVLHFEGLGRVDLLLANRPLSRQMLQEAKKYPQHKMRCVSPEGIIGLKIQSYTNDRKRELQDKADIKKLIEIYPDLNWKKVQLYAELFGEWETIKALKNRE